MLHKSVLSIDLNTQELNNLSIGVGLIKMSLNVTKHDIGAEIVSILTKGMYPDPRDALREYVQNGVDAGAKNIDIKIRVNSVVVEDDGHGMDEKTLRNAVRLGISDKNPQIDVGFRGIGIYSAFHLCDQLHIYSKSTKKEEVSGLLIFNFKLMRDVIDQQREERAKGKITGEQLVDLQSLLQKHTELKALRPEEFNKFGTRVEMIGLESNFFKSLSKFEDIAEYLRQVVPLHFNPDKFKWAKIIEDKIFELSKKHDIEFNLINLTLQVNTQIEKLYRPYTDEIFKESDNGEPLEPLFKEVKSGGEFFGVAWGSLNSARKKISDKKLRGFLITKQGFAIGDRSHIVKYFSRNTYFDRYIGEIIVLNQNLLPNAARTDFETSPLRSLFYEALSEVASYYNDEANKHQEFTLADEQLDDAINGLKESQANISYYTENTEKLLDILIEVRRTYDLINGRLDRKAIRSERVKDGEKVVKFAKELEKDIQRIIDQHRKKKAKRTESLEKESIKKIKKLPKVEHKEPEKQPENLLELLESLDIELSEQLKVVMEIIDEKYIQAIASNKADYLSLLMDLKRNIEERISGE